MTSRASHILLVMSAFLGRPALFPRRHPLCHRPSVSGGPGPSAIGGPFKLIDQNGKPITDADLKGRPYLVFFGYTHCPDVCPTTLFEISEVLRALGPDADQAGALFITVDPERDTPAVMKDYLSSFDPHLRGATGVGQGARRGRKGISRLSPRKCRRATATTAWTTPRCRLSDG